MNDSDNLKVAMIYLGKRGGGLHFLQMLSQLYLKNGFQVTTLMSNKRQKDIEIHGEIYEPGNFNPVDSIKTLGLSGSFAIIKSLFWIYKNKESPKIWIMSHPLDLPLRFFANRFNGKNFAVIHELTPHTGEYWPPKWASTMNIKLADFPITLSMFVRKEVMEHLNWSDPLLLPHPTLKISEPIGDQILSPMKYFLVVGRLRTYKGLDTLAKAWESICDDPYLSNWSLVIAGEGNLAKNILDLRKTTIINRWLEERELVNFIKFSQAIILPYSDASQSGILALEESRSVRKIVFSNGGLSEQSDMFTIAIQKGDSQKLGNEMLKLARGEFVENLKFKDAHETFDWESKWLSMLH